MSRALADHGPRGRIALADPAARLRAALADHAPAGRRALADPAAPSRAALADRARGLVTLGAGSDRTRVAVAPWPAPGAFSAAFGADFDRMG
ncbi:hypothetical protein R5H32_15945 [Defluviimonas sp. D31]|uniref:hypothetical protein n=1 Tax=Defluviimonas sp. D31 TaxID=3083253 RepID=UPI00296EC146|nr:hypothetical protein [Defluviimonas sp. D31]MDW4550854.1 hypothetical protein [Defluviimonas sp. D31]